jgi:chemotaxis protein CheZ
VGAGVQRKVFRVEQMFADRRLAAALENAAPRREAGDERDALQALAERREEAIDATVRGLVRELASVHEAIARNKQDLAALLGERTDRQMVRAAGELGAAVEAMEKATQKILQAAEGVDDGARSLGAALKNEYERRLAQDIQEHVTEIYEACNFQDLAGQRIAKVVALLGTLEEQLAAMLERCSGSAPSVAAQAGSAQLNGRALVNGPRLDGDSGYIEQSVIDAMFMSATVR